MNLHCSQVPSIPDPGIRLQSMTMKQRQSLPPPQPKRRKFKLPEPDYEPTGDETSIDPVIESEVDAIFDETPTPSSDLVSVHSKLPQIYWKIIPYKYFNRIQSATVDSLLSTNQNVVVSAPTVTIPHSNDF